jgi:hypothetical protein
LGTELLDNAVCPGHVDVVGLQGVADVCKVDKKLENLHPRFIVLEER